VACQDQDDISEPTRLERQVAFLEAHPEVGVVGTWPTFIDETGRPLGNGRYPLLADNESLQRQLILGFGFIGPSLFARRPMLVELGGYDPEMSAAEDYDLLLRLAEVSQVANVPEPLYRYRVHPGSVSSVRSRLQWHSTAVARERAARRRFGASVPPEIDRVIARTFLRAAVVGLKRGEMPEARSSLARAIEHDTALMGSGSRMEVELERFLKDENPIDRLRLYRTWFREMLPRNSSMARLYARLRSEAHMEAAFAASAAGDWDLVREHWAPGVRTDPRRLLNRGVWAIGFRQFFSRNRSVNGGSNGRTAQPRAQDAPGDLDGPVPLDEVRL
jgi:hypothetical protein